MIYKLMDTISDYKETIQYLSNDLNKDVHGIIEELKDADVNSFDIDDLFDRVEILKNKSNRLKMVKEKLQILLDVAEDIEGV